MKSYEGMLCNDIYVNLLLFEFLLCYWVFICNYFCLYIIIFINDSEFL